MNTTLKLEGLVAATHTPFHPDGSLAPEIVSSQARYLADLEIDTVFVAGSTGEGHSLTRNERATLFSTWAQAAAETGIQVIAHVGGNSIQDARDLAKFAADLKLTAIAALSPSYYKPPTVEALVDCCSAIAKAAPKLPFYYYDIPALTGVEFDMCEFLDNAQHKIPNLNGIKYTNSDLTGYKRALETFGEKFDLPWGIDEHLVDAISVGASGAVGSSYNLFPSVYRDIMDKLSNEKQQDAEELQQHARKLIETFASHGYLAGAKAYLDASGIAVGPPRLPLMPLSQTMKETLLAELEAAGLTPKATAKIA